MLGAVGFKTVMSLAIVTDFIAKEPQSNPKQYLWNQTKKNYIGYDIVTV